MYQRVPVVVLCALAGAVLTGCAGKSAVLEESAASEQRHTVQDSGNPPLVTDRFPLSSPDQEIVGQVQIIRARYEDTFVDIARAYNLGFDELVEANPGVDPWLPGEGTRIVLPTRFILPNAPREGIVINLANKRLFWYTPPDEDGARAVVTFPIGIGLEGAATPTGITTITQKAKQPTWFVPANIRAEYAAEGNPLPAQVPPGPDNPLGEYAMILGMPSYLIHGTNRPAGVGMRVSHGCVRLFPENIEYLYGEVPVGEQVTIIDQPWSLGWDNDRLYLEAHPPLQDDSRDWPNILPGLVDQAMARNERKYLRNPDPVMLATVSAEQRGVPLPILAGEMEPEAYLGAALVVNNIAVFPPEPSEQLAQDERR